MCAHWAHVVTYAVSLSTGPRLVAAIFGGRFCCRPCPHPSEPRMYPHSNLDVVSNHLLGRNRIFLTLNHHHCSISSLSRAVCVGACPRRP